MWGRCMSAIGPGDHVECVLISGDGGGFRLGSVYIVEEVGLWNGEPFINCVGMRRPRGLCPGWATRAFRPVHRPTTKFMNALMRPAPKEPVPA